jgi:hypothetical protein
MEKDRHAEVDCESELWVRVTSSDSLFPFLGSSSYARLAQKDRLPALSNNLLNYNCSI